MNDDVFTVYLTFDEREAILVGLCAQIVNGDTRQVVRDAVQKVSIAQAGSNDGDGEELPAARLNPGR